MNSRDLTNYCRECKQCHVDRFMYTCRICGRRHESNCRLCNNINMYKKGGKYLFDLKNDVYIDIYCPDILCPPNPICYYCGYYIDPRTGKHKLKIL
jgi:hypothetical protein